MNTDDISHGKEVKEYNYFFNKHYDRNVSFKEMIYKIVELNKSGLDFRMDIVIEDNVDYRDDSYLETR